jgi:hypothetical protein
MVVYGLIRVIVTFFKKSAKIVSALIAASGVPI